MKKTMTITMFQCDFQVDDQNSLPTVGQNLQSSGDRLEIASQRLRAAVQNLQSEIMGLQAAALGMQSANSNHLPPAHTDRSLLEYIDRTDMTNTRTMG